MRPAVEDLERFDFVAVLLKELSECCDQSLRLFQRRGVELGAQNGNSLLARDAKRCHLDNDTKPQPPSLSEADREDAEGFLDDMLQIYPVLNIMAFEKPQPTKSVAKRYFLRARGVEAEGYEDPNGFPCLTLYQTPCISPNVAGIPRVRQGQAGQVRADARLRLRALTTYS